jgi:hypothetical protein
MEFVLESGGEKVWRLHLLPGEPIPSLALGPEFKCVIWTTCEMGADWRMRVAERLIADRVRYVQAGGLQGTLWDDAVDYAYMATDPQFNPPDETFVMTTWHDDKSLADVLWFSFHTAAFDDLWWNHLLVLWIGPLDEGWDKIAEYARRILVEHWVPGEDASAPPT